MSPPTAQQAESWLPFVERVGLPWLAFLIMLGVNLLMVWFFSSKLLPELRAIALALQASNASNATLAAEIHSGNTPPLGVPVVPTAIIDLITTLKDVKDELRKLRGSGP